MQNFTVSSANVFSLYDCLNNIFSSLLYCKNTVYPTYKICVNRLCYRMSGYFFFVLPKKDY